MRPTAQMLLLAATLSIPVHSRAQEAFSNEDCLACHSEADLTRQGPGGEIQSLFVDGAGFERGVHGEFSCVDCHAGIKELPHPEGLPSVSCGECHDSVSGEYAASIHGRARANGAMEAPDCVGCHGDVHVLVSVTDPNSPVHPARLPETCGRCHSNPLLISKFGIPEARPIEAYRASVHARAVAEGRGGASCNDCHGSHTILPGDDPKSSVSRRRVPDTCGACHADIARAYKTSIHGTAFMRGVREAPVCTDCHGEHRILSPRERGSPVSTTNMPLQTCGRCHSDVRLGEKYGLPLDKVPSYENSYHGLAARAGAQTVASCASCHGVHDILPSSDPRSHVYPGNLPATCGQCHAGAGTRFAIGPVHAQDTESRSSVAYYIRLTYLPLIVVLVGGMLLHNFLDFIHKMRTPEVRALSVPADHAGPERMTRGFRIAHGIVVITFPLLVYSGFALKYPESWWAQPLMYWNGGFNLRGWLHRAAALGLVGAVVFHGIHLIRDRHARTCIAGMRPALEDWREFRERMRYYLGFRGEAPPGAKLGYIEKAEYLAFVWGTVVMVVTGFLLWFETMTLRWLPSWVPTAATAVHFYEAILASLAILVWHFYWVVFDPAVYPMDMSWLSGRPPVSRELERSPRPATDTDAPEA